MLYSFFVKLMIAFLVCGELYYLTEPHSLDEIVASLNASLIQFLTIYRYKNMVSYMTHALVEKYA